MSDNQSPLQARKRIDLIDVARGVALVAMAIYHFTWDLEFFGWISPGTSATGGWLYFARGIASSFLFLVGVSLVLAHQQGTRWPSFWKRFAQVAGSAALISLVTWFVFPDGFIFFGILHAIALFSLIGLLFVRSHWLIPLLVADVVLLIWSNFGHDIFSTPILWWVGLAPAAPPANDYVPTFPWLAPVLFGIAAARLMETWKTWDRLRGVQLPRPLQGPLIFVGRHSLVFYLVHQPILLSLIWAFTTFVMAPDRTAQFLGQCQPSCEQTRSAEFCSAYCSCIVDEMKQASLFAPYLQRKMSEAENSRIVELRDMCIAAQD